MDERSTFILIAIVLVAVLVGMLIWFFTYTSRIKKKTIGDRAIADRNSDKEQHNALRFVYNIFKGLPLLNRYFYKVRKKVEIMYPAAEFDIQKMTSKILFKAFIAGIAGIVGTVVLARGDIFFLCVGFIITFVLINEVINRQLDSMDFKFLGQMAQALTAVRHHFYQTKNVEFALRMAVDDVPYEIGLHLQVIHDIVAKPGITSAVDRYVGTEPNRYMLLFLSVCASTKEYGDSYDEDGTSHFISQLDYLKEEVENEIMENRERQDAFEGLSAMALAPIVAVKPLEMWARTNMEEIGQYYEGVYGIVAMIAIAVLCFVTYLLISYMKEGNIIVERNENMFSRLLAAAGDSDKSDIVEGTNQTFKTKMKRRGLLLLNGWDSFLQKVINKNYTKAQKYDDDLRGMGDHTGIKAFYFKRYFIGFVIVLCSLVMFISADLIQKGVYLNNWGREFQDSVVPDEDYRKTMQDAGRMYMEAHINDDHQTTSKEVAAEVQQTYGIEQQQAQEIAPVIITRMQKYKNTYFKFWYLLITALFAFVGYMAPVWVLKFRQGMIEMRKNDELVQFQSIMLILMNTPGTTLPIILEWMERFSYVFKESITRCRVSINHGHQRALKAMKDEQTYVPFKEFIDSLMEVDNVGITKAFDEIKSDRDYYKKQREQTNKRNLRHKSSRARLIVFIPLFATLILYLIGPMIMYAFNMLKEFQSVMNAGIILVPGMEKVIYRKRERKTVAADAGKTTENAAEDC